MKIKFRVWDKEEKQFIQWCNADPMIDCQGDIYCYERTTDYETDLPGEDYLCSDRDSKNLLVLQLYTGMNDKNGTEIFDGDIVEFNGERSFVMFCYGTFLIDGHGEFYDFVKSSTPDKLEDWIVIGNIFENKELLLKK